MLLPLVPVPDADAALLLRRFYASRFLPDPAAALRAVQLERLGALRAGGGRAEVRRWGGFVVVGP